MPPIDEDNTAKNVAAQAAPLPIFKPSPLADCWAVIESKNPEHRAALLGLLSNAFDRAVAVRGQTSNGDIVTNSLSWGTSRALRKVGYRIQGLTNYPGP